MKILVLANKLPYPPRDGGSIATLNMLTGLSEAGNELTCLALNTSKHSYPVDRIPEFLTNRIRFHGVPCDSSIRIPALLANLLFSGEPYIAERFHIPAFRRALEARLGKESFDVVQLEGPYMGPYLDVVRAHSKALVSFRAHNVEHLIWKRKAANERSPWKLWYFHVLSQRLDRFEMKMIFRSDCLVTISPLDEAYFRERGVGLPGITLPAGLRIDDYPETGLPAHPSLCFIGALDWLPNQEGLKWFLDHVWDSLLAGVPDLEFHVAGRNAPPGFERLLERDRVTYHGEVEDARAFMQRYRIMVAPLFTGSGIRVKILEAMALSRPVVTTPVGIEGIPARHGEEVLISPTADGFREQVLRLIADERLAKTLAGAGRKLIREKFDTLGLSTRLSRFYKEQV
jgi:glycosyltransferase involved in cell wall biosynthesis